MTLEDDVAECHESARHQRLLGERERERLAGLGKVRVVDEPRSRDVHGGGVVAAHDGDAAAAEVGEVVEQPREDRPPCTLSMAFGAVVVRPPKSVAAPAASTIADSDAPRATGR